MKIFVFLVITNRFIGIDLLPNKLFPIVFDSIDGICEKKNSSCFNTSEVKATMSYVARILNIENVLTSDIGTHHHKKLTITRFTTIAIINPLFNFSYDRYCFTISVTVQKIEG